VLIREDEDQGFTSFPFPFEILEGDRGSFLEGLLVLILLWLFGFLVGWVFHQGKKNKKK